MRRLGFWNSVVDLVAAHEAACLQHCRKYTRRRCLKARRRGTAGLGKPAGRWRSRDQHRLILRSAQSSRRGLREIQIRGARAALALEAENAATHPSGQRVSLFLTSALSVLAPWNRPET
jgi:hypothetical protein